MNDQLQIHAPQFHGPSCPDCGTSCESRMRDGEMYAWCDACDWNSITQDEEESVFMAGLSVDFTISEGFQVD